MGKNDFLLQKKHNNDNDRRKVNSLKVLVFSLCFVKRSNYCKTYYNNGKTYFWAPGTGL